MKFTNKYNLPEPFVNAVVRSSFKPRFDSISVTELYSPPIMKALKIVHWDEIVADVSEYVWSLFGQGIHAVLQKNIPANVLSEEKMSFVVNGVRIVGKPDIYYDSILEDYKVASTFTLVLDEKKDWETQLNIYAWMYRQMGFPVTKLRNQIVLRDWVRSKSFSDPEYPKIPWATMDQRVWSNEAVLAYITKRVELYRYNNMAKCNDTDKWARPASYAVMREGLKRALRVLSTEEEAAVWMAEAKADIKHKKANLSIVYRPGEFVRCKDYCQVRQFCPDNPYRNQEVIDESAA